MGEALWIVVVLCSIAFAYAAWRIRLWRSRSRWSRTLLPRSGQLSWKVPPSDQRTAQPRFDEASTSLYSLNTPTEKNGSDKRKGRPSRLARPKRPAGAGSAAPDSAVASSGTIAALIRIKPEVLRAIQVSTAQQLRSVDSIRAYVQANFHHISATSAESWMQRLEEFVAGDSTALARAGGALQRRAGQGGSLRPTGRRAIEVKEGGARKTVTDLRMAVKTKAHMVHGLSDFDHDAITTASKDAISVMHEGFDPGLHIPLGTLLRSAWRELELLFDKKVPIERAVKHVAMDVASVGTGAFVGAKVGGGIGAIAGPVGVGAGLLVGAMAGAIAGRGLAHKSRMAPFSKAYERYETILSSARSGVDAALMESKGEVKQVESVCQAKFEAARSQIESDTRQKLEELERKQIESLERFLGQFPSHLGALETQLHHEEAAVLKEMPPTHWWNWIFPRRKDLERSVIRRWFKRTRKTVMKERRRFEKLKRGPVAALHSKVHRFLNNYTFSLRSFDEDLGNLANEFAEARIAAETIKQTALGEVEEARNQVLAEFRERITKMYLVLCQTISDWKEKVEVSLDELRKQARPLGVELPD
jgi:hypothetical protein